MVNDSPNLSDHDFPVTGYLLNMPGYMFLETKESNTNSLGGLTNA